MALAALILSVLALFMAGASALYTKRQADATTATAALEAERRHGERTPLFDVWKVATAAKSNEIPAVRGLLACFDLTGVVVTVDAMHTQSETATAITSARQTRGHPTRLAIDHPRNACAAAVGGPHGVTHEGNWESTNTV